MTQKRDFCTYGQSHDIKDSSASPDETIPFRHGKEHCGARPSSGKPVGLAEVVENDPET